MKKKRNVIFSFIKRDCKSARNKKSLKPPTEAQLMQRDKFRVAMKFVKHAREMVMIGYDAQHLKKMTPVNLLTRQILASLNGEYPDYEINYSQINLSSGKLDGVIVAKSEMSDHGNIKLIWEEYEPERSPTRKDDEVFIFIYNAKKDQSFSFKNVAARSDLSVELKLPSIHKKEDLHCWMFLKTKEGCNVSWCEYYTFTG